MSLPFWEDKCWGRVLHCFANEQASVSYLEVLDGYQCSIHYHKERANTFVVVSGIIVVEEWWDHVAHTKFDGDELAIHKCEVVTTLLPGHSHTVPSRRTHRFKVMESGSLIEVYFPDNGGKVDIEDIIRLNEGGPIQ